MDVKDGAEEGKKDIGVNGPKNGRVGRMRPGKLKRVLLITYFIRSSSLRRR